MSEKLEEQVLDILHSWFEDITRLIKHRQDYRNVRQFDKADEVRNILASRYGIVLKDTETGLEVEEQK